MSKVNLVNEQIKEGLVRLVLSDGSLYGEASLKEALEVARNEGKDLVQVSPGGSGNLPVCKVLDYGKMKYKSTKHKKGKKIKIKEIRYGFNISEHDLEVKHKKVFEFLQKKHSVRYVLEMRGRQSNMVDEGLKVIKNNLEQFEGKATWHDPKVSKSYSNSRIATILNPA